MTAPDHTTRAVELTTQALDADQGITIRHITVAAAQVEATVAVAEALDRIAAAVRDTVAAFKELPAEVQAAVLELGAPRVDRPRWDDDLRSEDIPCRPELADDCPGSAHRPFSKSISAPLAEPGDLRRVIGERDRLREGIRGISARLAYPEAPPAHVVQQTLLALLADDETHRNPITVAGTPAEQRHREEKP